MALLFQRLARNFICNGYYPTDSDTLTRILSALAPVESGVMRILDPTCGEGVALAECKQQLGSERAQAYGIEFDAERAWHAKTLLNHCIHADFQNCIIDKRSFGLLFLNPPYGDMVADKGETGDATTTRQRLEKLFYSRSVHTLQFGGVLVLIVPYYSLDKEFSQKIAQHFTRVEVYLAPETRFKQVVIFGVHKRNEAGHVDVSIRDRLLRIGQGELPVVLPEVWQAEPYRVPAITQADVNFFSKHLDAKQLAEEITKYPCLWPQFAGHFNKLTLPARRPLMPLSKWHLALVLATGQVAGLVTSRDGRSFLIKGDTHKEVVVSKTFELTEKNEVIEITTHLDRFVPVIRALDVTPQSAQYGAVLTIR